MRFLPAIGLLASLSSATTIRGFYDSNCTNQAITDVDIPAAKAFCLPLGDNKTTIGSIRQNQAYNASLGYRFWDTEDCTGDVKLQTVDVAAKCFPVAGYKSFSLFEYPKPVKIVPSNPPVGWSA